MDHTVIRVFNKVIIRLSLYYIVKQQNHCRFIFERDLVNFKKNISGYLIYVTGYMYLEKSFVWSDFYKICV